MPKLKTLNDLKTKRGGSWKLDDRHKLVYSTDDENQEEALKYEASIIAAEENSLVVAVTGTQKNGRIVTSLAQLKGTWRADDANRLEFEIERRSGKNDTVTFTGSWTLNENHELTYTYRTKQLKTKTTRLQTLVFKGFWDLSEKNRLAY